MNTPFISPMHLSLPLLLLLGKATIILLAALGITLAMQRASAGARHLVWLVTVAALLLVPALAAWGPVRVAVLPTGKRVASSEYVTSNDERVTRNERARPDAPSSANALTVRELAAAPEASTPGAAVAPSVSTGIDYSLLVTRYSLSAWLAVALAILASLAWSGLAVRRIVRNASPLDHPSWRTPLYEVADRMGLADAPRLLRSDDAKMPFACGIVTPTIVLPADCDGWSMERRHAVLLHELAHVRRHDLLGHTLGRLACAVYWFHPLVWTAARHLRNESERACDDLALACGTRATDYAEHLLEIVTSVRKDATPSVALAMARRKEFEGRMLAILDPELRHSTPTRRQSAALIGSLALVALTVGAVSPVARSAEAAQPAATRGTTLAAHPAIDASSRLIGPERTTFRADTARSEVVRQLTQTTVGQSTTTSGGPTIAVAPQPSPVMNIVSEKIAESTRPAVRQTPDTGIPERAAFARETRGQVRTLIQGLDGKLYIAKSKDERAQLLAKVLATDTSAALRRVAAWGLHEYADQQVAADALSQALRRDASATVREMAAWALADGDHNPTASDALAAAVRSDADEKVRATAAWALGEVGDRGAVEALVAALSSTSASVRTRALWAIGNLEPKAAPREVMTMLRDPEPRVRKLAAWALFQIEDPASVGALQEALKTEQNGDVQLAEIRAIGAVGEKSVEALKALVESSDPRMRSMAVHALAGRDASGPWPWPWPEPRPYP